jgi:hypothetical protein
LEYAMRGLGIINGNKLWDFFWDTHLNLFQRIFFKVLMGPQIWANHCKYHSKSMNNNRDEYFRNIIGDFENNFTKPLIEQFLKKSCTPYHWGPSLQTDKSYDLLQEEWIKLKTLFKPIASFFKKPKEQQNDHISKPKKLSWTNLKSSCASISEATRDIEPISTFHLELVGSKN